MRGKPVALSGRRLALIGVVGVALIAVVGATIVGNPSTSANAGPAPVSDARASKDAVSKTPAANASTAARRRPAADPDVRPVAHTIVTLITGDRVRVSRWSDGTTTATMTPGSPSFGKPVRTMHSNTAVYVIPDLPLTTRERLGLGLFNVTWLAQAEAAHRRVAVDVVFRPGVTPHDLPGVTVDRSSAKRSTGGTIAVTATYANAPAQLAAGLSGAAWRDVSRVQMPAPKPLLELPDYHLYPLTVDVSSRTGRPVGYADVWVQNVDDGRLFNSGLSAFHGSVKVQVPAGTYSVIASGFDWLVSNPEFTVSGPTTTALSAADATIVPREHVGTAHLVEPTLSVTRVSAKGGSFTIVNDGFLAAVQPHSAAVSKGALSMTVGGQLQLERGTQRIAVYTKDLAQGIPARTYYRHQPRDFAVQQVRSYSTGRPMTAYRAAYGIPDGETFSFFSLYASHVPSSRTVWEQANPQVRWLRVLDLPLTPPREMLLLAPLTRLTPGAKPPLDFMHNPVGPGIERGTDVTSTGPFCALCRRGSQIDGFLPLASPARTGMFGELFSAAMGSWSLVAGRRQIAAGHGLIAPHVDAALERRAYTLTATSTPTRLRTQLSSRVQDIWTFQSAAGRYVVPILIPSYLPPTNLSGVVAAGRVAYRLSFDNLGPQSRRVVRAGLSFSVDHGRTWTGAKLTRLGPRVFRATYVNPAPRYGRSHISLRVTGRDAAGRTVSEQANRAYRIGSVPRTARIAKPRPRTALPRVAGRRACTSRGINTYTCFAIIQQYAGRLLGKGVDPRGYGAPDLEQAYGLTGTPSANQTVAVVVAYHDPRALTDLNSYREQFGLPRCTRSAGCFRQINQRGQQSHYPTTDQGWALEAALDLQMISAACPDCRIVLSEADSPTDLDLGKATDAAVAAGANVTNHSYGIFEHNGVENQNAHYAAPGVTAVAASGDSGFGPASFPASSPDVVSVGGTTLHRAPNQRGWHEDAWRYGGSGCSAYFAKPAWQSDPSCLGRTYADISAVGDNLTGVAVYDSFGYDGHKGWFVIGGTSVSSPLVAGMIGRSGAGGIRPASWYGHPGRFHDVVKGSNGFCRGNYLCTAKPGYDAPTGWGSPRSLLPFTAAH